MAEPLAASSALDVLAAEPAIRRVVAARVANASDIDDLVQDCLERLLGARDRLAPETILPFGIVTARNLVISHARTAARHATAAPRLVDIREPERPEEALLLDEERLAMTTALSRLSADERRDILAYYDDGPLKHAGARQSPGALRVRMARTRAKLRLEYLLAFRHVTLPTQMCSRVLLAVSAGDTRRQRELSAGQHLLDCETCAMLSEPLERRSIALTAITLPPALAAWAVARARAHPLQAVSAGVATATAAAAIAAGLASRPGESPRLPAAVTVSPSRPAPPAVIGGLLIGRRSVPWTEAQHSLRGRIGQPAAASGVVVQHIVTRDGFWIGYGQARIWVQLTGPLRPLRIVAGDHLRFSGTVVENGPSYAAQAGLASRADAALLKLQGAHLDVSTTHISVQHPPRPRAPEGA